MGARHGGAGMDGGKNFSCLALLAIGYAWMRAGGEPAATIRPSAHDSPSAIASRRMLSAGRAGGIELNQNRRSIHPSSIFRAENDFPTDVLSCRTPLYRTRSNVPAAAFVMLAGYRLALRPCRDGPLLRCPCRPLCRRPVAGCLGQASCPCFPSTSSRRVSSTNCA